MSKYTNIYIIYCISTEQSIFRSAIQTSKTRKIVFKKYLLERVSVNILSINQSCICFLIDKNRISNTELILHLTVLLNNCSCKKKIGNCSEYCKLVEKIENKFRFKVCLIVNKKYTIV